MSDVMIRLRAKAGREITGVALAGTFYPARKGIVTVPLAAAAVLTGPNHQLEPVGPPIKPDPLPPEPLPETEQPGEGQ